MSHHHWIHAHIRTVIFHRSPHFTGCRFAWIPVIFGLVLSACTPIALTNTTNPIPVDEAPYPSARVQTATVPQPDSENTGLSTQDKIYPPEPTENKKVSLVGTPVPTMTPTVMQTAVSTSRPLLFTSDLLFLSDKRLVRWDHITHFGVNLAENVVEFSTAANGKYVALLRTRGIAANGIELFDIDLLDFETKHIAHLAEETPSIKGLTISPDGNWLAFEQQKDQKIVAMRISFPTNLISLGSAHNFETCGNLAWSPDSQSLLWCDQSSIWIAYPGKKTAYKLNSGITQVLDPKGNLVEIKANYQDLRWSPAGRYALVKVMPEQSNVRWQSLLDTRTGQMVQVVDSYTAEDTDASLTWLEDGSLAVAHASDPSQMIPLTIQIWNVVPTSNDLLISKQRFAFEPQALFASLKLRDVSHEDLQWLCIEWLQPMSTDHLLLGTKIIDSTSEPVMFDLNLTNGAFVPLSQISQETSQVLWAPDGSGFLMYSAEGRALFYSVEDGKAFELTPYSDATMQNFTWLSPKSRR